ncbi:MAG: RsbRD N-terminal domain-containing protein [Gemmatimonadaceae bacterium]
MIFGIPLRHSGGVAVPMGHRASGLWCESCTAGATHFSPPPRSPRPTTTSPAPASSTLAALLREQQQSIAQEWAPAQVRSAARTGAISEAEEREQCAEFLRLLADATTQGLDVSSRPSLARWRARWAGSSLPSARRGREPPSCCGSPPPPSRRRSKGAGPSGRWVGHAVCTHCGCAGRTLSDPRRRRNAPRAEPMRKLNIGNGLTRTFERVWGTRPHAPLPPSAPEGCVRPARRGRVRHDPRPERHQ